LFDVDLGLGVQHHRSEFFCDRGFLQRIEILTAIGQQFLRDVERDPRTHFNCVHVFIWRINLVILLRPTRFND
jgi:hypothetical protein